MFMIFCCLKTQRASLTSFSDLYCSFLDFLEPVKVSKIQSQVNDDSVEEILHLRKLVGALQNMSSVQDGVDPSSMIDFK